MRAFQYDPVLSVVSFVILTMIWLHSEGQGKLEDRNNRVFRKLVLWGMVDVSLDFLTALIPSISSISSPFLYTAINTCYNLVNVYMCYLILFYTDSLREKQHELSKILTIWALVPEAAALILLMINFRTGVAFYYDRMGIHYSGSLGQFVYVMAALYFVAAIVLLVKYRKEYGKTRIRFIVNTFILLGICILMQLFFPKMLAIDLGIALSTLSFYLFNNNPIQFVDKLSGALDKNYFDTWVQDQIEMEKCIYLIAVRIKNMSYVNAVQGEKTGNWIVAQLAKVLRKFDHDKTVFRLSGSCLMVHCHDRVRYLEELGKLREWFGKEEYSVFEEHGCILRLIGIPNAQALIPEYSLNSYIDYLIDQMNEENSQVLMESSQETIAGFRYEMEIERYLKEALDKDLFSMVYQPIYHLKERRYVSVESLTRLQHPVFGNLNPQKVINTAEHSGLINELTRLQFRRLCGFMKAEPDITRQLDRFKFNLSPLNLLNHAFIKECIDIIEENGLPFTKFEFEFTESFATEQNEELRKIIELCQTKGITLSLDDFGSGYSNLSNVLQIPFKSVKLDRSLLLEVCQNERMASFYEGIVHLMQNFDMDIICEGVETEMEKNLLDDWGADMIQGYYYSKPLDGETLKEFLKLEQRKMSSEMT